MSTRRGEFVSLRHFVGVSELFAGSLSPWWFPFSFVLFLSFKYLIKEKEKRENVPSLMSKNDVCARISGTGFYFLLERTNFNADLMIMSRHGFFRDGHYTLKQRSVTVLISMYMSTYKKRRKWNGRLRRIWKEKWNLRSSKEPRECSNQDDHTYEMGKSHGKKLTSMRSLHRLFFFTAAVRVRVYQRF